MSCQHTTPRPTTIGLGVDGIRRAVCACRRPIVQVDRIPGRQEYWRHTSKVKVKG